MVMMELMMNMDLGSGSPDYEWCVFDPAWPDEPVSCESREHALTYAAGVSGIAALRVWRDGEVIATRVIGLDA